MENMRAFLKAVLEGFTPDGEAHLDKPISMHTESHSAKLTELFLIRSRYFWLVTSGSVALHTRHFVGLSRHRVPLSVRQLRKRICHFRLFK